MINAAFTKTLGIMAALVLLGLFAPRDAQADISYRYAINLMSSRKTIDPSTLPRLDLFNRYLLYETSFKKDDLVWHRLRLGFFPTRKEALEVLNSLRGTFRDAWVTKVSKKERERSAGLAVNVAKPGPAPSAPKKPERPRQPASTQKADFYAITLVITLEPVDPSILPRLDVFEKYRLYRANFKKKGRRWHMLRLGFFPSREAAHKVRDSLRGTFPDALVNRITKKEKDLSARVAITAASLAPAADVQKKPEQLKKAEAGEEAALPSTDEERHASLMDQAKEAMTRGDYPRAIQLYTKILQSPDHKYRQDAQELLGLARERNGQLAHARAEYKEYLRLYPKGEGAERVRQRLAGLETARSEPREKLRKAKKKKLETEVYGTLSQFYNRDESYTDLGGNVVNRSSLSTDLDLNIRRRGAVYDISSVFIGGYEYDFLGSGSESEGRISRFYLDVLNRSWHVSGRFGRQWSSTGGVLGRFDGALFSYSYFQRIKVNVVTGFPVDSTVLEKIDTDRYFYGLNLDLGTFAGHWDFNVFVISQEVDGITDRQAVGGEVRYFHTERSFFSLVDYDTSYDELNTLLFVGNWIFPNKSTINLSVDYRQSPSLSTTNALQGQSVNTISDLLKTFSKDEVRDLARDRTATNWSATLGGTYPINKKLQVSGDLTVSELAGTDASGGVAAVPGTGTEYFYSAQLIGNSIIKDGDIAIFGLRYSDASSSDTITLNLNTRFPVNRQWRINPRFQVDFSQSNRDDGEQWRIRPSLRTDYYWRRRVRFEFEGGAEWSYDKVSGQTDLTRDYFLITGYRVDF